MDAAGRVVCEQCEKVPHAVDAGSDTAQIIAIVCSKVLRSTRHEIRHFADVLSSQSLGSVVRASSKTSLAESVARLQRGRLATPHQPISAELRGHVTASSSSSSSSSVVGAGGGCNAVVVGMMMMRFAHMFLEVEVAAESARADGARERLDGAVRVHVKRQVVHLTVDNTTTFSKWLDGALVHKVSSTYCNLSN